MSHTTPTRLHTVALFVALGVVAAACGGGEPAADRVGDGATVTTVPLIPLQGPPTDYAGYRSQTTACGAEAPLEADGLRFDTYEGPDVAPGTKITLTTSCGDIVIALDPVAAPETTRSFVFLAEQGYFDGTVFHRIFPGFVIQGGDPEATGFGGPGYVVPDEFPPADFEFTVGVVAMANAGPGATGSQFFIMVNDAGMSPLFSVFGTVTAGSETLQSITLVPLATNRFGERSVPLETIYIESVAVSAP